MFNLFSRRPSQIKSQSILESGIDRMVSQRDHHLSMMNQLETVIDDAQRAYNQHTRLYKALNNSLFAINHPFDVEALEADLSGAFDAELSVDQPSDGERIDHPWAQEAARPWTPQPPTPQELADAAPLDMPANPPAPVASVTLAAAE